MKIDQRFGDLVECFEDLLIELVLLRVVDNLGSIEIALLLRLADIELSLPSHDLGLLCQSLFEDRRTDPEHDEQRDGRRGTLRKNNEDPE